MKRSWLILRDMRVFPRHLRKVLRRELRHALMQERLVEADPAVKEIAERMPADRRHAFIA